MMVKTMFWMLLGFVVATAVIFVLTMPPTSASASLKVGDRAPDFALTDQDGKTIKLADYRGKNTVVLAFYIKANTPG